MFYFTPRFSHDFREITHELRDQEDFRKYILENMDQNLVVTIERRRDKSEHSRLSTFFNGVIVPHYVKILFDNGENINKVEARDRLKNMFLREYRVNDRGDEELYTKSQKDLSTPELLFFINQVLMHILEDYDSTIPDMDTYTTADIVDGGVMFKIR